MREQGGAGGQYRRSRGEQRGSRREPEASTRKHGHGTGISAGAKRRVLDQRPITCCTQLGDITYI